MAVSFAQNVKSFAYRLLPYAATAIACVISEAAYAGGSADVVTGAKYLVDTGSGLGVLALTGGLMAGAGAVKFMHAPIVPTMTLSALPGGIWIASPRIATGFAGVMGGGGAGLGLDDLATLASHFTSGVGF